MKQSLVSRIITSLLDNRDFMSYQLTHAKGHMSDKELDKIATRYFNKKKFTNKEIKDGIKILRELIGNKVDADIISTIFRIDFNKAISFVKEQE